MKQAVVAAQTGAAGRSTGRSLPIAGQPLGPNSFCHACWSGEYPIAFVPHPRQRQMRLLDC
jgi:hypothetical protein